MSYLKRKIIPFERLELRGKTFKKAFDDNFQNADKMQMAFRTLSSQRKIKSLFLCPLFLTHFPYHSLCYPNTNTISLKILKLLLPISSSEIHYLLWLPYKNDSIFETFYQLTFGRMTFRLTDFLK